MSKKSVKKLKLEFEKLPEVVAYVDKLRLEGYHKIGNWSLAEILDHLRFPILAATRPTDFKAPFPVRVMAKLVLFGLVLRTKRMSSGMSSPKKALPGDRFKDDNDLELAYQNFCKAVEEFCSHTGEYLPNPIFGKLNRDHYEAVQCIHCAHHLGFLIPDSK